MSQKVEQVRGQIEELLGGLSDEEYAEYSHQRPKKPRQYWYEKPPEEQLTQAVNLIGRAVDRFSRLRRCPGWDKLDFGADESLNISILVKELNELEAYLDHRN